MKELFSKTFIGSGEKELYELIKQALENWNEALKSFRTKSQTGHFPGKPQINDGLVLVAGILEKKSSFEFIERFLQDADALESFVEKFEDLDDFYDSQFHIWQSLSTALNESFKANLHALEKDPQASKALQELKSIYDMPAPYGQMRRISHSLSRLIRLTWLW